MGSGKRFTYGRTESFGAGFAVARFPFALTIDANLFFWFVSIGFGKGYDEVA